MRKLVQFFLILDNMSRLFVFLIRIKSLLSHLIDVWDRKSNVCAINSFRDEEYVKLRVNNC